MHEDPEVASNAAERRVPIFNVPSVVVAMIAALAMIHVYRLQLSPADDLSFLVAHGFIPARLALAMDWLSLDEIGRSLANSGDGADAVRSFLEFLRSDTLESWLSLVTYAGLHGGWSHLILNALWFLAFGSVVARRLGPLLFIVFCLVSSVAAALFYAVFDLDSVVPMIGASGAVSAAMGAALLLPFYPAGDPAMLDRLQAIPLMPPSIAIRDRRVVTTTLIWFGINALLAFGIGTETLDGSPASIAWQAHIGGYIVGMMLIYLLDKARPRSKPLSDDTSPPDAATRH